MTRLHTSGPDHIGGVAVSDDGGAAPPPARLTLLGGFELICEGAPRAMPLSAQRVLAFLALSGRPSLRAHVAGTLWIDASETRAASALRTAIWRMGAVGAHALRSDASRLALAPGVEVDIVRLTGQATAVLGGANPAADIGLVAAIRDARDLLPGWYDDWVLIERERFRQLRLHALERLCLAFSEARRHADATQAGLAAIAADPLRESAHRALVAAHLAQGNAGDALRQYVLCRDLLARELGVTPSDELERLVATLRRPHPAGRRGARAAPPRRVSGAAPGAGAYSTQKPTSHVR